MTSLSYEEGAHLLRRMAFGGSPDEINAMVARSRESAVDFLINYQSIDNSAMEAMLAISYPIPNGGGAANGRWVSRMAASRRQFEEKMTFFWHNHFATGVSKVDSFVPMYLQNETLRQFALDSFDTLLLKVAQDPAMSKWLDNNTNTKTKPNENFARELQELFTMGPHDAVTGTPNYTEKDVREIARAFTGWGFKHKNQKDTYKFKLFPSDHDFGSKEIYGQTANFEGEDVVTIICARRATARFLSKKLVEFFVYPLTTSPEDLATIEKFADVYLTSNHSIKALVRAIFTSDEFYSDRARFSLIKTPLEFVVNPVRMLEAHYDPGPWVVVQPITIGSDQILFKSATAMGLEVFNPPDVSGWNLNLGWINTGAMLQRYNFANYLISNRVNSGSNITGAWLTNEQISKYVDPSAEKTVDNFLTVLGPLKVDSTAKGILNDFLQTDDQGNRVPFVVSDETIDKLVRGLICLIISSPEFQLN